MDGWRDFTWNKSAFSNPSGLVSDLKATGFKGTALIDPGVKAIETLSDGSSYEGYVSGRDGDHFIKDAFGNIVEREVWPGWAAFPDYTKPSSRDWWGDQVAKFMEESGLEGIWIDMNEPAIFDNKVDGVTQGESGLFPLDAVVDGEGTAAVFSEVRNVYGYLMAEATFDGMMKKYPDRRPFQLTRAGFTGVQRYSAVWTGDSPTTWEMLYGTPGMLQGLGLSGVSFTGSDIGGFYGTISEEHSAELYTRWFQIGAFSPFFRSHVMTDAEREEPWVFGEITTGHIRKMLEIRYKMLPYWYNLFEESARTGAPIIRPLWYDFTSDEKAHENESEFFIGSALLVAPVTAKDVTSRTVYLPEGLYYDFYTNKAYQGAQSMTVPAPIDTIPIFAKAGSIIPQQDLIQYVGDTSGTTTLYLDIYPGTSGTVGSTEVYEDDGESMAYKSGTSSRTPVSLNTSADDVKISIGKRDGSYTPLSRDITIRLHGVGVKPSKVTVDGSDKTVSFDSTLFTVSVTLKDDGNEHNIVIAYDTSKIPEEEKAKINFNVTLPGGTPAGDIYVAYSAGAWDPAGFKLTRSGDSATGTMDVLEGTSFKYKITRGAWGKEEVDGSCAQIADREVTANGSTNVNVTVAKWADQCN